MGTLLHLEDPVPRLQANLATIGVPVDAVQARAALGAEIAYYRAHHLEGRDAGSLHDLRLRCAAVLAAALPAPAPAAAEVLGALLGALRFRAFPEVPGVLGALRARGLALAAVSNWDVSLPEALAGAGLELDVVVSSAAVGAAKPDPAPLRAALGRLGIEPAQALLVGDSPAEDRGAARAAGVPFVLIRRDGANVPTGTLPVIGSLSELGALLGGGREGEAKLILDP
jgi:putative hydrolase of the HAD superfamily